MSLWMAGMIGAMIGGSIGALIMGVMAGGARADRGLEVRPFPPRGDLDEDGDPWR